jgi:Subtilisin-like serine proteases
VCKRSITGEQLKAQGDKFWNMRLIFSDPGMFTTEAVEDLDGWDRHAGSPDVGIAVLDSGVFYNTPCFYYEVEGLALGNLDHNASKCFLTNYYAQGDPEDASSARKVNIFDPLCDVAGHGTYSAGIIGAKHIPGTHNPTEVKKYVGSTGMNEYVTMTSYKVLDDNNVVDALAVLSALEDIAERNKKGDQKIHVVNMSLEMSRGYYGEIYDEILTFIQKNKDIIFVISAGNDNCCNLDKGPDRLPADAYSYENVLVVGMFKYKPDGTGFDLIGEGAYGEKRVHLLAPAGVYAPSSSIMGVSYVGANGTSIAAPHVAGAAGLIRSIYDSVDANLIVSLLKQWGNKTYGSLEKRSKYGILNLSYLWDVEPKSEGRAMKSRPATDMSSRDGNMEGRQRPDIQKRDLRME